MGSSPLLVKASFDGTRSLSFSTVIDYELIYLGNVRRVLMISVRETALSKVVLDARPAP